MGDEKRDPKPTEGLHDPVFVRGRIWGAVGWGAVGAILILAAAYGGCSWLWGYLNRKPELCQTLWASPPWTLISGIAAAPALILLWRWRTTQRGSELALAAQQHALAEAQQGLLRQRQTSDRFADAMRLLAETTTEARLGGIYSLEQVARDSETTHGGVVVKTLSAFVRGRVRIHPNEPPDEAVVEPSLDVQAAVLVLGGLGPLGEAGADLSQTDLCHVEVRKANLRGAILTATRLIHANFADANLSQANLRFAKLQRAKLVRSDLSGSDLRDADLTSANLSQANLRSARLQRAKLVRSDLSGSDLRDADLASADCGEAYLDDANLAGANLFRAELRGAAFPGAGLDGADFTHANLASADLSGASLIGADLSDANLTGAYLDDANLSGADLSGANLEGANLRGVNLDGATLIGANLGGANLEGANLSASFSLGTTFPEGFNPEAHGMILVETPPDSDNPPGVEPGEAP